MQAIDAGTGEGGGDAAENGGEAKRRFVLPKRVFLLALAGIALLLALIVAGGMAYYSKSKAQDQVRAEAQERMRAERAQAAAQAAVQEAENRARLEAARKAHREILESGTSAPAVVEVPVQPTAAEPPLPEKVVEKQVAEKKVAEMKADANKRPEKPLPAEQREQSSVIVPGPGGGCSISGSNPPDYGKALGRCLEEFNRLEGR
ncbi:MAG: hypothetical protein HYU78_06015 [Rhodocyclales bacterium]|nr:hypothetical protein [Rhodocyclales bacterium]